MGATNSDGSATRPVTTTSAPLSSAGRRASAPRYALAERSAPYSRSGRPDSRAGTSRSRVARTSSPVTAATRSRKPRLPAISTTRLAAASGLAAPMLVTIRTPLRWMTGRRSAIRRSSNGSVPPSGSCRRRNCASAMVRSARHSSTRNWIRPRSARMTAGSRRSPENPAPAPIRTGSTSISPERMGLREEQVAHRIGALLDGADLVHEQRRLEDLLRPERVLVVRIFDDAGDVVDSALLVVRLLEVDFRRGAFVLVDRVDGLGKRVEERAAEFRIRLAEAARGGNDQRRRAAAEDLVRGRDRPHARNLHFLFVERRGGEVRVDAARAARQGEEGVGMRQADGERSSLAYWSSPHSLAAAICNTIACVETLTDGTA